MPTASDATAPPPYQLCTVISCVLIPTVQVSSYRGSVCPFSRRVSGKNSRWAPKPTHPISDDIPVGRSRARVEKQNQADCHHFRDKYSENGDRYFADGGFEAYEQL